MTPTRDHAELRLTVDLAILTVRQDSLQVLVVSRGKPPFEGVQALPGGFLRVGEDVGAAAVRELREETGLDASGLYLQQLPVFGAPKRDPRGRIVTVPYLAIAPDLPIPVAGSDAAAASWRPVDEVLAEGLAFDHADILNLAVETARHRLEYTTVATAFCGPEFTVGELRRVYEVVWGQELDPRNFNRKVTKTEGFVKPLDRQRAQETGRPAALYARGDATVLYPPMLRSAS